jgi:hypothetical protein
MRCGRHPLRFAFKFNKHKSLAMTTFDDDKLLIGLADNLSAFTSNV